MQELELVYPQIMKKINFELSTKPYLQQKAATGKSGFVRFHCSMGEASDPMLGLVRCKILVKNYERTKRQCDNEAQSVLCQANAQKACSFLEMSNGFYTVVWSTDNPLSLIISSVISVRQWISQLPPHAQ